MRITNGVVTIVWADPTQTDSILDASKTNVVITESGVFITWGIKTGMYPWHRIFHIEADTTQLVLP